MFQLASGVETSLSSLIALLGEVSGRKPRIEYLPTRPGEIERNYSLIEKARDRLGYAPQVSLADGVRETWEWFAARVEAGV